jgi:hypothetical protein
MSNSEPVKKDYYLKDIVFDEYSVEKVYSAFKKYREVFSLYDIRLEEDTSEDKLILIPKKGIQQIVDFEDELKKLGYKNPKLRYAYEFHSMNSILARIDKHLNYCESSAIRVNNELQKMYAKEKELSLIIPFSEFKMAYEGIIDCYSVKAYNELDYDMLFVQALLRWLSIKGNVSLVDSENKNNIIESIKSVNPKVFSWAMEKLFSRSISDRFDIFVQAEKSYVKTLVKRTDTLGKKMSIDSTDFILFEASLDVLNTTNYSNGKRFRYPDASGQEYVATSKYVMTDYSIGFKLFPSNIDFKLPIYVAMLKSKNSSSVK